MWVKTAGLLLVGYLCLSRTFAYVGIPAWKAFIGEAVLVLFVVAGPRMGKMKWPWIAWKMPALRPLLSCYALFLGYGVIEVLRGIKAGNPALVALRDLAFNLYPVYFLLGIWAGVTRPDLLPRLIRGFAWFNGIYGVLYILFLNRVNWYVVGDSGDAGGVPIFGQPLYSFVALLGLLAFEKSLSRSWHLYLLNGFVMLGMQIRTEWLAFAIGVAVWCVLTRQGVRVVQAGVVLASLLAVMYFTDLRLPSPQGRTEADFSVKQLVDRGLAPFRADVADEKAAAGSAAVDSQEATFVFRTFWWFAIWDSVHSSLQTTVLGHGYGFPLGDLVPYLEGAFIRTPHNEFFFALGYTGWVGVALFSLLQFRILRLLIESHRITAEPFGVVLWAAMMVLGMFFPLCETPYGAIPFYLILGWCIASLIVQKTRGPKWLLKPEVSYG
jgi:O-Antigen ligase